MTKYVSVNLFSVDFDAQIQKLSKTIEDYDSISLEHRWRGELRLDRIEKKTTSDDKPLYFLDFSKEREIGPGKLKRNAPVEGINLAADETFAEETAALYIPHKKWLLVLHNQNGIGPNRIMNYFNNLDNGKTYLNYLATPMLNPKVDQQLNSMRGLTVIEFDATSDYLTSINADDNISLSSTLSDSSIKRVKVTLNANPKGTKKSARKFLSDQIRNLVSKLRNADDSDVSRLVVKGPDDLPP